MLAKVRAVAACNDTNKKSIYSDFGDAVWCSFPSSDWGFAPFNHPDALTNGIYTTDRIGLAGYNEIGDYTDDFGGTSSACPGVAGVAALILSANPDLTWLEVRNVIKDTCEKIDVAGGHYAANNHSKFYGYGKVDAEKAVKKALSLKVVAQLATVRIVSAMIDPNGADIGHEKISLRNTSTATVNLSGWAIEIKGKKELLTATLAGGETKSIELSGTKAKLSNTGATINLLDASQHVVHTVTYKKMQVKKGLPIEF
jgi:subtilisin family serine protease